MQDYDQVVFSSAFRRLQRKTQVMPLPETDVVGRSLGRLAARHLLEVDSELAQLLPNLDQNCGDIIAAACLAHDIGNLPFGHSDEGAISSYFLSPAAAPYLQNLTAAEVADLQYFEGNAAGFCILTHTYAAHSTGTAGLGLTYATLGAFTKYPRPSMVAETAKTSGASEKKCGHFQIESARYQHTATELGLLPKDATHGFYHRHPLAFLVEVAHDLYYRIIDFEDGLKLGLIAPETGRALLKKMLNDPAGRQGSLQWHDWREELGYVRVRLIGKLVNELVGLFAQHVPAILRGTYD